MPPDEVENLETPPDNPPGDPSLESQASESQSLSGPKEPAGSTPATSATPPPPLFTPDQIRDLANGISQGITQGFKPTESPKYEATPPTGPTPAELQTQIQQLDEQIDLAVQEGKPIVALQRQRDHLRDQKFEVERLVPLRVQGANSINSLTIDAVRRDDPYFARYEKEIMDLLGTSMRQGQALTVEIVREALSLIKGRHINEILNDDRAEATRKSKLEAQAPLPSSTTGRQRAAVKAATPDTIKERFGVTGDEAFNVKRGKGYTEDTFARRMGFKDKADWFARDDEMSSPNFNIGLDSVWDKKTQRWVTPDELNEFYGG
jgi:hypothetical protein